MEMQVIYYICAKIHLQVCVLDGLLYILCEINTFSVVNTFKVVNTFTFKLNIFK